MSGEPGLASKLHEWAVREMQFLPSGHYSNSSVPTVDDFSQLCRGQLLDVWKFLIDRIRRPENVHKTRGNLKLKKIHNAASEIARKRDPVYEELEKLRCTKNQLQEKVTAASVHMEQSKENFHQTRQNMVHADQSYNEACNQLTDLRMKLVILQKYDQSVRNRNEQNWGSSQYLETNAKRMNESVQEESQELTISQMNGSLLHTPARSHCDIHDVYGTVCDYFNERILTTPCENEDDSFSHRKQQIGNLLVKTFFACGSCGIINNVTELSRLACNKVKVATAEVDVKRDISNLRFQYSSGQLVDLAEPKNIPQTITKALEEVRNNHIKMFFQMLQCRNNYKLAEQLITEKRKELDTHLEMLFNNREALNLMHMLLDMQLEFASTSAALEMLRKCQNELRSNLEYNLQLSHTLETQYTQIKNFEKLRDLKLKQIKTLIEENVGMHGLINLLRSQINEYVHQNLNGKEKKLISSALSLKNQVKDEIKAFTTAQIDEFHNILLRSEDSKVLFAPAIHGFSMYNQGSFLGQIAKTLGFPLYKSPDVLLSFVLDLKSQVACLRLKNYFLEKEHVTKSIVSKRTGKSTNFSALAALPSLVSENDQKQLETTMPKLKQMLTDIRCALNLCTETGTVLSEWWDQPAQNVATRIKIDDMTFQEWKTKLEECQ